MNKFVILCVIALYGASYSAVEGASRIVGGTPATKNQFNYMVSLQQRSLVNETTRGHRCGGAMVSYRHALTAASCLYDNIAGRLIQILPVEYRLFVGSTRLDNDDARYRIGDIISFTVHPEFIPGRHFINDIAIITIEIPFANDVVTPVSLPVSDITFLNPYICKSPGWGGQNGTATASYQLMYTQQQVTDSTACSIFYNTQGTTITMEYSMLCAIPTTNSSGCQGDTGNPLVCDNQLAGILFLSKNCSAPIPDTWSPDVYTRVFSYKAWVNGIIIPYRPSSASTYQPGVGLLAMFALVQIITLMS